MIDKELLLFNYYWSSKPSRPDGIIDGKPFFISPCHLDMFRNVPCWFDFNEIDKRSIKNINYIVELSLRNMIWEKSKEYRTMFVSKYADNSFPTRLFCSDMANDLLDLLIETKRESFYSQTWLNLGAGSNAILVDRVMSCFGVSKTIHIEINRSQKKTYSTSYITRFKKASAENFYPINIQKIDVSNLPNIGGIILMNPSGDIKKSIIKIQEIEKSNMLKGGYIIVACEREDVEYISLLNNTLKLRFEYESTDKKNYFIYQK